MKALTKKILESGLVDEHVARMMEKWGQLDAGASDLVGRKEITKQSLVEFAEELEGLIESKLSEVRETSLDFDVKHEVFMRIVGGHGIAKGFIDSMDCLILPLATCLMPETILRELTPGSHISLTKNKLPAQWHDSLVGNVDEIYQDDKVVAVRMTLSGYVLGL